MIKKLFLLLFALVAQTFAPLEVRKISGEIVCSLEDGLTEAQIYARVSAESDIPQYLFQIIDGGQILGRGSEAFLGEGPLNFVELVRDCMVSIENDALGADRKIIRISSDRFPGVEIVGKDGLSRFNNQPLQEDSFHRIINYLCEKRKMLRLRVFSENTIIFNLDVSYKSEEGYSLYFDLAFIKWLKETLKFAPSVVQSDEYLIFCINIRRLFDALRYDNYPELDKIREQIHSRALKMFPSEIPEVLKLRTTSKKRNQWYFTRP